MPTSRIAPTFVDTNVFVHAVGRAHPLREPAQMFLRERMDQHVPLATSAEVLQELLHVYLPVNRLEALDAALRLAHDLATIWPIDGSAVRAARDLATTAAGLGARDLIHLAVWGRYDVGEILTFDRALLATFATRR